MRQVIFERPLSQNLAPTCQNCLQFYCYYGKAKMVVKSLLLLYRYVEIYQASGGLRLAENEYIPRITPFIFLSISLYIHILCLRNSRDTKLPLQLLIQLKNEWVNKLTYQAIKIFFNFPIKFRGKVCANNRVQIVSLILSYITVERRKKKSISLMNKITNTQVANFLTLLTGVLQQNQFLGRSLLQYICLGNFAEKLDFENSFSSVFNKHYFCSPILGLLEDLLCCPLQGAPLV